MPVIVAGGIDTDAIATDTVYSDESCIVESNNQVTMSNSSFFDIPNLTISLTLDRPAAVLQLAQIDFMKTAYQVIAFRPSCDGQAKNGISRAARYSSIWGNVFLVAFWPGLAKGSHTFKIQSTAGDLKNRKHCLVVMRR